MIKVTPMIPNAYSGPPKYSTIKGKVKVTTAALNQFKDAAFPQI